MMTQEQKDTLRFYTTNDYLLINGLLWGEDEETIDRFIRLINTDGRGVMAEAAEQGPDVRWNCSKEEGDRLFRVYQRRFPVLDGLKVKEQILAQARQDIANLFACMEPLSSDMELYRNMKTRYLNELEEGMTVRYLGFSSCSLNPHSAENAVYGSGGCTLVRMFVPAGTPAIRLDRMPDVQNEPDEVILAPTAFQLTRIDRENNKAEAVICQDADTV